jgi:PAS domain S-box-containing protein
MNTLNVVKARPAPVKAPDTAHLFADDEARFIEVDDAAIELLRYSREQLLTMHVWEITTAMQLPGARELWKEFIKLGEQSGAYQVRRADGRLITVDYHAVANVRPGAHLSMLRPLTRPLAETRELDECPFDRPFPDAFKDCATYQPFLDWAGNSRGEALEPAWTCTHLSAAQRSQGHGYYGRCGLGDAQARTRWLVKARVSGLRQIQELRASAALAIAGPMRKLYGARAAVLASPAGQTESWHRLHQARVAVAEAFAGFTEQHAPQFEAAGIAPAELGACQRELLDDFAAEPRSASWSAPERIVRRYPSEIRAFMRPDLFAR